MRFPLSANQNKLFRHYQFFPNDPSYNQVFLYKITGNIDLVRLKKAIKTAYHSIDVLKVHFGEEHNVPYQCFKNSRQYELEVVKMDHFQNILQELLSKGIDLFSWPLTRFILVQTKECSYLLATSPHIISDGLSYTYLIHKINQNYKFDDGGVGEKEKIEDLLLITEKDLEFFKNELSSFDSLEFKPIKQKRDQNGILQGNIIHFELPKELIEHYLRRYQYSESSFFLAIHVLLLKKLFNEEKVIVGLPVLNRNKANKKLFGYFVNTLPLVIDFTEIQTFAKLIEAINRKIMRLLRHQSFDLNRLKQVDSHFTTYFTYYAQEFNYEIENVHFERIYLKKLGVGSEFTFTVENRGGNWMLCIESGECFSSIDMQKTIKTLTHQVTEGAHNTLREIPLINEPPTASEVLVTHEPSILSAFKNICELYPQNVALNDFSSTMTYEELDKKSNQIARFIQQFAGDSKYVIISVSKNNDLIALILGILKAGKCYVPIDQFCPHDRFEYIMNKLDSSVVIAERQVQLKHLIPTTRFASMKKLLGVSQHLSSMPIETAVLGTDPAYIIFTSGTTGSPKGVQISHLNLRSLMDAAFQKFSFGPYDVWTLFHSYSFDFSVWEIFGSLLTGGTLLIIDPIAVKTPALFYSILSQYRVTVLNQTPTAFSELIRVDQAEQKPLCLRMVIFGGEALCFPNLKNWVVKHPLNQTKLINMYGITEITIHATYYEIQYEDLDQQDSIIGRPLSNLGCRIINGEGHELPQGMTGEIAIYGNSLSSGYYGAPDLTEKKFVQSQNLRFYLSGDLGKVNVKGDIVFLGRKDRQVQIRGFRVELDEIEYHILQTGFVERCAIDAISLEKDTQLRIVAYLILKKPFHERKMKELLTHALPFYMIPTYFICVDHLPLTINGKIDFKALKNKLKFEEKELESSTPTEKLLTTIISNTIRKGNFSTHDNFGDIGVTSIDLASIFFKIKTDFDIDLNMAHLFQYTTIQKLADFIDQQKNPCSLNDQQTSSG